VSRIVTLAGSRRPPSWAARAPATARRLPQFEHARHVALATGVTVAAGMAGGQDDPALLAALGLASLTAAAGAFILGHRSHPPLGLALVAASQVAAPAIGLRASLYLLVGALTYALLYARRLAPRTPFAIVAGGAAAGCFALAGWQSAASSLHPTPLLLAALIFLWVPGHAWSLSLAIECEPGARGVPLLPAVAGRRRTAAAVFATSVAVVAASLVLAPRLPWLYAAVALPAGACLLAATLTLRRRSDAVSARRAFDLSALYLSALSAALVLASL
jgi:heme O synthase-like polyprenyltransferase